MYRDNIGLLEGIGGNATTQSVFGTRCIGKSRKKLEQRP